MEKGENFLEVVNRRRTDNIMAQRKRIGRQTFQMK